MNLYLRLLWLNIRVQFRSRLGLLDKSVTSFRVWPSDLDPLMHMNNSKYFAVMDLARLDLMMRSGAWASLKKVGWYPVVAGQTISYYRSLNPWKRFEVRTQILGLDDRWGYIEQRFMSEGKLCARAIVRTRFLKRSGGSVDHHEFEEVFGEVPGDENIPAWILEWAQHARPDAQ